MSEWVCVEVKHHKEIGSKIEEYEGKGWHLHTYQAAGMGSGPMSFNINHYLLFERAE